MPEENKPHKLGRNANNHRQEAPHEVTNKEAKLMQAILQQTPKGQSAVEGFRKMLGTSHDKATPGKTTSAPGLGKSDK